MRTHLTLVEVAAALLLPLVLSGGAACQVKQTPATDESPPRPPAESGRDVDAPAAATAPPPAGPGRAQDAGAANAGDDAAAKATAADPAQAAGPGSPEPSGCSTDPRVTPFVPNLQLAAGETQVRVISTQPAGAEAPGTGSPQMGLNKMTVEVLNRRGTPVQGAHVRLQATMPDHAHGGSEVRGEAADGAYRLNDIDLMMPGVWKFDFSVKVPRGRRQHVAVHLCIPG